MWQVGGCWKQEEVEPIYGQGRGRRNQGGSPLPGLGEMGLVLSRRTREAREASEGDVVGRPRLQGVTARTEGAQRLEESPKWGWGARGGSQGQGSKRRGSLSGRGEGKPGAS